MSDRLTESEIAALCANLVDVVGARVVLVKKGREYVGLCPFHDEKTPSFTVAPAKGFYHCFGCGAHGNALTFVMRSQGVDFVTAVSILRDGNSGLKPVRNRRRLVVVGESERRDWARSVWRATEPAGGTLVETYLRARGIDPDRFGGVPLSLRYHPHLKHPAGHFPAMVAEVQGLDGHFIGIHRTYLAADGCGKARVDAPKMMAGKCWGGAVRLGAEGPYLAIAEGIETALTIMHACTDLPVWAALSIGNIAGAGCGLGRPHPDHPGDHYRRLPSVCPDAMRPGLVLPCRVERVILIADADNKDRAVGEALLARAVAKFRDYHEVRIARPTPGCDFNDMLMAG